MKIEKKICYGLVVYVVDPLRTCYGKIAVMDFGLNTEYQLRTFPRNFPVNEEVINLLRTC